VATLLIVIILLAATISSLLELRVHAQQLGTVIIVSPPQLTYCNSSSVNFTVGVYPPPNFVMTTTSDEYHLSLVSDPAISRDASFSVDPVIPGNPSHGSSILTINTIDLDTNYVLQVSAQNIPPGGGSVIDRATSLPFFLFPFLPFPEATVSSDKPAYQVGETAHLLASVNYEPRTWVLYLFSPSGSFTDIDLVVQNNPHPLFMDMMVKVTEAGRWKVETKATFKASCHGHPVRSDPTAQFDVVGPVPEFGHDSTPVFMGVVFGAIVVLRRQKVLCRRKMGQR
jgi:hypothetical protein